MVNYMIQLFLNSLNKDGSIIFYFDIGQEGMIWVNL